MCETKGIITEEARFHASKTIKKIYWYVFFSELVLWSLLQWPLQFGCKKIQQDAFQTFYENYNKKMCILVTQLACMKPKIASLTTK